MTDGEDNASKKFTKDAVWELTQTIIGKGDVHFNFLQIGKDANAQILGSIKQFSGQGNGKISSLVVDDNAGGIRTVICILHHSLGFYYICFNQLFRH